jgi:peptidoglycan/LPS O-acetylase OafA/YrhL
MNLGITGSAGRYPSLDGLRGIAIIAVLLRHAAYYWPQPLESSFWNPWINGWLGVNLFFVLSGFLIFQHLLNWWPEQNIRSFLSTFFLKRFLRIIPVYLITLALAALCVIPEYTPVQPINWEITLQHLLFIQEYYSSPLVIPLWSVATEEKFYLLAPLIVALFLRSNRAKFLSGLAAIASIYVAGKSLTILLVPPDSYENYFWTFRAPFQHAAIHIAIGSSVALITHKRPSLQISTTTHKSLFATLCTILILIFCSIDWLKTKQWLIADVVSLVFTAACAGLAFLLIQPRTYPHPILESRPLLFFAKISYPLYATHIMLIPLSIAACNTISEFQQINFLAFAILYLALSIALALIIHLLIEKPFLRIKDRLQYPERSNLTNPKIAADTP